MGEPNTTCRVCRKKYFCCSDSRKINSWRTVACCPECYKEYIRRINMSRHTQEQKDEPSETETQADVPYKKPATRKKKTKIDME